MGGVDRLEEVEGPLVVLVVLVAMLPANREAKEGSNTGAEGMDE